MKRRDFLLKTGFLAAGGTNVLATGGESKAAGLPVPQRSPADAPMKTALVTSAHTKLAQAIAGELRRDYQVRLTAPIQVLTEYEVVKTALTHDKSTTLAVRGADAIVHVCEPLPDVGDAEEIDYRTRCTYKSVCHVRSHSPSSRFPIRGAHRVLGYRPDFGGQES